MADVGSLRVEVLLAEAEAQRLVCIEVARGCTAWQAVERSGLLAGRDGLGSTQLAVAIFGKQVPHERELEDGDRVEVLRPLQEDPKSRRRRAARAGKALGRR